MNSANVDVLAATDAALMAEHNRPAPKHHGTYKVARKRAIRAVAVRNELERRGLVEPIAKTLARIGGAP